MKEKSSFATRSGAEDEIEGTAKKLTGKMKEAAGKVLQNPRLEAEGGIEQLLGRAQKTVGKVKKILGR